MDRFGISAALLTPFTESGAIDLEALGAHARRVLEEGVAGVTLFGTTGEGASIARDERDGAISALLDAGVPAERMVLGVCETALREAVARVAEGLARGVTRFLVLPPFYFKGCTDDALFDWHMGLITQSPPSARFILYHIPQVSGVPLSAALVARLAASAGARLRAVKDSAGDWDTTREFLDKGGLPVLVGDERLLHKAVPLGAEGSICGMANLYPARLVRLVETAREDPWLNAAVTEVVRRPVIASVKALLAEQRGVSGWERLRLPLAPLDAQDRAALLAAVNVPDG